MNNSIDPDGKPFELKPGAIGSQCTGFFDELNSRPEPPSLAAILALLQSDTVEIGGKRYSLCLDVEKQSGEMNE